MAAATKKRELNDYFRASCAIEGDVNSFLLRGSTRVCRGLSTIANAARPPRMDQPSERSRCVWQYRPVGQTSLEPCHRLIAADHQPWWWLLRRGVDPSWPPRDLRLGVLCGWHPPTRGNPAPWLACQQAHAPPCEGASGVRCSLAVRAFATP